MVKIPSILKDIWPRLLSLPIVSDSLKHICINNLQRDYVLDLRCALYYSNYLYRYIHIHIQDDNDDRRWARQGWRARDKGSRPTCLEPLESMVLLCAFSYKYGRNKGPPHHSPPPPDVGAANEKEWECPADLVGGAEGGSQSVWVDKVKYIARYLTLIPGSAVGAMK